MTATFVTFQTPDFSDTVCEEISDVHYFIAFLSAFADVNGITSDDVIVTFDDHDVREEPNDTMTPDEFMTWCDLPTEFQQMTPEEFNSSL